MAEKKSGKKRGGKGKSVASGHDSYEIPEGIHLTPPPPETVFELFKTRLQNFFARLQKRGRERLTIMIIPHTEKKILNMHMSVYAISGLFITVAVVLLVSIMSLVGKSGEDIEFYDMGLTNSQFNLQSIKMAEEMLPVHELINQYANTIAEIYVKLEGSGTDVFGQGGVAQAVVDQEVENLRVAVEECRKLGDQCGQEKTEEILQRITYLSKQDNQNLNQAIDYSDKILKELNSREKQSLLQNTPGIWPTHGYILSPYGEQVDPILGRKVFKNGIEIGAFPGAEVVATAPGEISQINYDEKYGLSVWITHKYGIRTFYSHLGRLVVSTGDKVNRGETIGYVGKSGNAPLHMLYYEVHVGTVAYNPHAFLNHLQDEWLIQQKP